MRTGIKHIFLFLFFCIYSSGFAQNTAFDQTNFRQEVKLLMELLQKNHVEPRVIDDHFSSDVFEQLITYLDPRSIYFKKADIDELSVDKLQIDNDIKGESWVFFPKILSKYKQCLGESKRTSEQLLQINFNLRVNDYMITSDFEAMKAPATDQEYLSKRKLWLKYQILNRIHASLRSEIVNEADLPKMESEAREKVLISEQRSANKLLDHPIGYEAFMASAFLNSILFCHDAHSYYMSTTEYQNMISSLSKDVFSFGIDLEEDEYGNIIIERLQPGGPAWRSNQLHKGDQLVRLRWDGKPEMDLNGADLEEINEILSKSNTSKMEFSVLKTTGSEEKVTLVKEKLEEGQNIVKSFVLRGEKAIGYISLPGFYSEWENSSNLGCANDVAKEIFKLKKEGIEALILDIRFNGGGSLREGMELAGIFINEGVLAMAVSNDKKPVLLKDANRGTVYDGPLVVMVNKQSASASELLAAALQDYNRAVVIGCNTYGKGSGQRILSIDTSFKEDISNFKVKPPKWGFAAITFFKLYKSSGKSVQRKGLIPDVHLPDLFDWVYFGEEFFPFALSNDSIIKKIYSSKYPPLPIPSLLSKSAERLKDQQAFKMVDINDPSLDQLPFLQNDTIPLLYSKYISKMNKRKSWWKEYQNSQKESKPIFAITATQDEQKVLQMDSYSREISDAQLSKIKQDIYIKESFLIATDLIHLSIK